MYWDFIFKLVIIMSKMTYCLRPLERKDIDDAVIALLDRDAPMKQDNTGIIRNYYVCFVPQTLLYTVEKLWGFVPVKDYPHFINHSGLEFGIVGNVRLFINPYNKSPNNYLIIQAVDDDFICVDSQKIVFKV